VDHIAGWSSPVARQAQVGRLGWKQPSRLPVKFGETCKMATPSQACQKFWQEGVETRWQVPSSERIGQRYSPDHKILRRERRSNESCSGTHNLKVTGSNPVPATKYMRVSQLSDALFLLELQSPEKIPACCYFSLVPKTFYHFSPKNKLWCQFGANFSNGRSAS